MRVMPERFAHHSSKSIGSEDFSRYSSTPSLPSDTKSAMDKLQLALDLVGIISVLCCFSATAYTPADNYLISCGSSAGTTVGQRFFVADDDSGSVTLTSPHSAAVRAPPGSVPVSAAAAALYQTARVFAAPSSYAFKIRRPGRHFLRLHFFPVASGSHDLAAATFKLSTQDAVLIDAFTPAKNGMSEPVRDEFLLDVARDTLVVTFVPLDGGVAFVNAVEVVSVPDDLMAGPARTSLDQQLVPAAMPLQTAYRVNVGGPAVAADNDTLWREWTNDRSYLAATTGIVTRELAYNGSLNHLAGEATRDDAPDVVYATARQLVMSTMVGQMTWQFDVDKRPASYLIRFHWCDIVSRAPHQLSIDLYVGSYMVATRVDLPTKVGNNGTLAVPCFMDFILDSSDPSGKIIIYVGSSLSMKENRSAFPGPILNGIEIMKMRIGSGSVVVVEPSAGSKKHNLAIVLASICGAFAVVSIAVVLVIFLRKKQDRVAVLPSPSSQSPSSTPWMPLLSRFSLRSRGPGASGAGGSFPSFAVDKGTPAGAVSTAGSSSPSYRFPLAMIQEATDNFDERLVIGAGGFGKVYRAVLPDGTKVAAKRASPESRQGAREFRAEVELLSGLRHRHLVSLVGYCDDGGEMVLLYEHMEHGSLRSRLYGGGGAATALSWEQRLEACAGAARGLLYLHTALAKPVIHRDVKSSNILLDGGLAGRVADFGLSRAGPEPELDETHVSTAVKGSFGYVDPEYARTRKLTAKSDVYSLGVVLLEALCGRPAVDPRLPKPMVNLVEWALHWQRRGELDKVVDRRIAAALRPQALAKYGETAARCVAERGADRPAMEDVVWSLQFVMRLQEDAGLDFSDVNSLNFVRDLTPPSDPRRQEDEAGGEGEGATDGEYTDVSMRGVFWQMVNVGGR